MNYGKYDTICCKRCFYLFICNGLFCIDQENQLLIMTNTMNIITILQPSNFNVIYLNFLSYIKNFGNFSSHSVFFKKFLNHLDSYYYFNKYKMKLQNFQLKRLFIQINMKFCRAKWHNYIVIIFAVM